MQRDLPVVATPFLDLVAEAGVAFEELRRMHGEFLSNGRMRRLAAVLHHRKAGFGANAMGVWAGPQDAPAALQQIGEARHCFHGSRAVLATQLSLR